MEEKDLQVKLDQLKTELEKAATDSAKTYIAQQISAFEEKHKEAIEGYATLKTAFEEVKTMAEQLKADAEKNQPVIDAYVMAKNKPVNENPKTFGEAYTEELNKQFETNQKEFKAFANDRKATIQMELKVDVMTIATAVTGDVQASYGTRQGIVPNQKVNARDLIPTVQSPTGLYVTYRETAVDGAIAVQTEGSAKATLEYDFTEIKTVSNYTAGTVRFSKQLMYALPWLQTTLQRMLLRDFYKKENSLFYTAMTAATGNATVTPTVDVEQIIAWIANEYNADFTPSFILVNWVDWQDILITKPNDYSVPGGVMIDANGNIRIAGVPIIGASWVPQDKALIIDRDYVERVETESLRVEFSYEDQDNFVKNLVTAKVECFENFNLLRTDAHILGDFGNVS